MPQEFPCPKCGMPIPVGQRFCGDCGERFQYICGHCGAAVGTPSEFCTNCGAKLPQQTPPTAPPVNEILIPYTKEKAEGTKATSQPVGQVGRYLIVMAIIVFIGAIVYAVGTSSPGENSNWVGNFIFRGQSPPSTPPSTPTTIDTQQTPKTATDSPSYTANQVVAATKKLSPICRAPAKRTG